MSTTRDLATISLAEAAGVSKEFANLWATIFAEKSAANPIEQGETDDQWITRLAREVSAEVQAICETYLVDRDAFRSLASALAVAAKTEVGHRPARKSWAEVSAPAREILEMKQARKEDTE